MIIKEILEKVVGETIIEIENIIITEKSKSLLIKIMEAVQKQTSVENEQESFLIGGGYVKKMVQFYLEGKTANEIEHLLKDSDIDVFFWDKFADDEVRDLAHTIGNVYDEDIDEANNYSKEDELVKSVYKMDVELNGEMTNVDFVNVTALRIGAFDIGNRSCYCVVDVNDEGSYEFKVLMTKSTLAEIKEKRISFKSMHSPLGTLIRGFVFEELEGDKIDVNSIELVKWMLRKKVITLGKINRILYNKNIDDALKLKVTQKIIKTLSVDVIDIEGGDGQINVNAEMTYPFKEQTKEWLEPARNIGESAYWRRSFYNKLVSFDSMINDMNIVFESQEGMFNEVRNYLIDEYMEKVRYYFEEANQLDYLLNPAEAWDINGKNAKHSYFVYALDNKYGKKSADFGDVFNFGPYKSVMKEELTGDFMSAIEKFNGNLKDMYENGNEYDKYLILKTFQNMVYDEGFMELEGISVQDKGLMQLEFECFVAVEKDSKVKGYEIRIERLYEKEYRSFEDVLEVQFVRVEEKEENEGAPLIDGDENGEESFAEQVLFLGHFVKTKSGKYTLYSSEIRQKFDCYFAFDLGLENEEDAVVFVLELLSAELPNIFVRGEKEQINLPLGILGNGVFFDETGSYIGKVTQLPEEVISYQDYFKRIE